MLAPDDAGVPGLPRLHGNALTNDASVTARVGSVVSAGGTGDERAGDVEMAA